MCPRARVTPLCFSLLSLLLICAHDRGGRHGMWPWTVVPRHDDKRPALGSDRAPPSHCGRALAFVFVTNLGGHVPSEFHAQSAMIAHKMNSNPEQRAEAKDRCLSYMPCR
ncbi:hypothetical protein BJV77DRAFT_1007426 [Russula vinacea]|nr:hypothetical protein BJV77DRAFT_1007426 [Russula vinacea]